MSVKTKITGVAADNHKLLEANTRRKFEGARKSVVGLVTYTDKLHDFAAEVHPFLNSTFGTAMNQEVSFSGTPELIFDGGSGGTEWAPTANAGSWNFADSGKVTITNANNLDSATWDDAGTINMADMSAITGKIDLDTYNTVNNGILMQFGLGGVPIGTPINLNDYIDAGNFNEQSYVIPKADLGIIDEIVDEVTITILRSGGTRPVIKFDDLQINEVGNPLVFSVQLDTDEFICVRELVISIASTNTGITTVSGATENATVPNLSYNKFMSLDELTNGLLFIRTRKGKVSFAISLRSIGDFMGGGATITNHISDGVNTFITLRIVYEEPLVLDGSVGDSLNFIVGDDLSGLLKLTAIARGAQRLDI